MWIFSGAQQLAGQPLDATSGWGKKCDTPPHERQREHHLSGWHKSSQIGPNACRQPSEEHRADRRCEDRGDCKPVGQIGRSDCASLEKEAERPIGQPRRLRKHLLEAATTP